MNHRHRAYLPTLRRTESVEAIPEDRGFPFTTMDRHEAVEMYRAFADGALAEVPHAHSAYLNSLRRRID